MSACRLDGSGRWPFQRFKYTLARSVVVLRIVASIQLEGACQAEGQKQCSLLSLLYGTLFRSRLSTFQPVTNIQEWRDVRKHVAYNV